jgi:CRISPR-associated protein Csy2
MSSFILIPRLKIQNANALSSPYTIGFPAMTSWLGAVHALERKLTLTKTGLASFSSVAVLSHDFKLHAYKGSGDSVSSIIGTANPLNRKGERSSFIEEARCNLTVSLLIELNIKKPNKAPSLLNKEKVETSVDLNELLQKINELLHSNMKIAGGDILSFDPARLEVLNNDANTSKLLRKLMPSYALIERRDLVLGAMNEGMDALDAILSFLQVMHRSSKKEDDLVEWLSLKRTAGWLVPIAVGFQGISEIGNATNQREPETLHRFAEAILTLGEFVMPHKIKNIDELLWQSFYDAEHDIYQCKQKKSYKIKESING